MQLLRALLLELVLVQVLVVPLASSLPPHDLLCDHDHDQDLFRLLSAAEACFSDGSIQCAFDHYSVRQ